MGSQFISVKSNKNGTIQDFPYQKISKKNPKIFFNEEALYDEAIKLDKKKNFFINFIFYMKYKIGRFKTKVLKIA